MSNSTKNQTKNLVLTALFAAITFVATAYIMHIPTHTGYIHIGDAFIYLGASFLPTPYAMAAGALGAALSDGLTGYAIWIIPSVIIKGLTAFLFTSKASTILCKRNYFALSGAILLCAGGYYIADVIMTQSFAGPLPSILTNLLQAGVSVVIYIVVGFLLDKMDFKRRIVNQ